MKMLSLGKFILANLLLCATIVGLHAQGQQARSSSTSIPSTSSSAILCQPGFVLRCSSLGCFCVRP
jgi:hypothetical protein